MSPSKTLLLCMITAGALAVPALADDPAPPLPLKKVVLFNSGVGFFEHDAQVDGTRSIELKFNVDDINDLLKSMVLQDLGGGKVSTVTYSSKDPITKTLGTFAIDLTSNPSLADLLDQVRGERVEIEAPNKFVGTILGVEHRKERSGKDDETVDKAYLNLVTDDGLRSLPLSTVARIKLESEKLNSELRQALTVLAMGHATDKKSVTLQFTGEGKRPVRVGYIQQAPIWKTSYRLVLSKKEPPFLQGWAIVENTTEHDWQDVGLTLVSGRPISFVMNLYDPLYVSRPVVEPELFASLRPQTYGQDLAGKDKQFAERGGGRVLQSTEESSIPFDDQAPMKLGDRKKWEELTESRRAQVRALQRQRSGLSTLNPEGYDPYLRGYLDVGESVQSAAQAANVGELFQYVIESPVTLPRRQSAMLPIVNGSVRGEKVSIYNERVQVKHPLNGLRLTNSSGLHLMQGPITVFDEGVYAGDARIEDLPPNSERLLSYALDLDTEVAVEGKGKPQQLVSCKIAKGTLLSSHKNVRSREYTVKNSGEAKKQVLIEYPHDANWQLTAPEKPAEKTRDLYRFAVEAAPGKPATLKVEETQTVEERATIGNLANDLIQLFLRSKDVSGDVKQALGEVVKRKQQIAQLTTERARVQARVQAIGQEQARIRDNMRTLDHNSDLYLRYVKKFDVQETEVEQLRNQGEQLDQRLDTERRGLDDYLLNLNVG